MLMTGGVRQLVSDRGAAPERRPFVTLSYAQSLDGSIAGRGGGKLQLSGEESLQFVHRLRSLHDAIVVGINTVFSDNPRLTVRYCPGKNPQPVVIDTRLRIPPDSYLVKEHPKRPWVAVGPGADAAARQRLEQAGVRIFEMPVDTSGAINLAAFLEQMAQAGVRRLMVEGGARIITSFLHERLVDRIAVTIAPLLVGGMSVIYSDVRPKAQLPRLTGILHRVLGGDLVLQGKPVWTAP